MSSLRCNIERTALEFAKTLVSTDQAELIELAAIDGFTTATAAASVAFDFAEAFHLEMDRRRPE